MLRLCIPSMCIALLAMVGAANAATFKITVDATLDRFSIDGYEGDLPSTGSFYDIADPSDPVLENFGSSIDFVSAAFSNRGKILIAETIDFDTPAYSVSGCTGVFVPHCQLGGFLYGVVDLAGFDILSDAISYSTSLSSVTGRVSSATDDDYSWTNTAGFHSTFDGETLIHDIDSFSVEVVPLPGSMYMALGSLVLLGALARRKRAG